MKIMTTITQVVGGEFRESDKTPKREYSKVSFVLFPVLCTKILGTYDAPIVCSD